MPTGTPIMRAWSSFGGNTRGGVVGVFGLALPVMAIATGAVLDYSRPVEVKGRLQRTPDGSALAGAKALSLNDRQSDSAKISGARSTAQAYIKDLAPQATTTIDVQVASGSVRVGLSEYATLLFGGLLGQKASLLAAGATAVYTPPEKQGCLIALDPNASVGVGVYGSALLEAPSCSVWSNSGSGSSMSFGGSSTAGSAA